MTPGDKRLLEAAFECCERCGLIITESLQRKYMHECKTCLGTKKITVKDPILFRWEEKPCSECSHLRIVRPDSPSKHAESPDHNGPTDAA